MHTPVTPRPAATLAFHPQRYWRHWISHDNLRALPFLPKRVAIDELKEFGMVGLRHTNKPGTIPALAAGFYRTIASDGRLYVVEISRRRPNVEPQAVLLYRPIVRVKAVSA